LEAITDQFTQAGADPEAVPNQNPLSQLRTNEIALAAPWELREFRLDANNTGYLKMVTAKQTPDFSFHPSFAPPDVAKQQRLMNFVLGHKEDILSEAHQVPIEFPSGQPMVGGSALTPVNFFWPLKDVNAASSDEMKQTRHLLSLGSCNGCHAREAFPQFTAPDNLDLPNNIPPHFTHVRPRQAGQISQLSSFLTGIDPADPTKPFELQDPVETTNPAFKRQFSDLEKRAAGLKALVEFGAVSEITRLPLDMVH
jgi:hypothetical protein